MSSVGMHNSLRKILEALKDMTTIRLAKINSDYKIFAIFYYNILIHRMDLDLLDIVYKLAT